LYLKGIISLLDKISLFDKVLILTIIRLYRSLESPIIVNTSTITDPLKVSDEDLLNLIQEISDNWKVLGHKLNFTGTKLTPAIDHRIKFTPGSLRIRN
jgi:hypothetical protein